MLVGSIAIDKVGIDLVAAKLRALILSPSASEASQESDYSLTSLLSDSSSPSQTNDCSFTIRSLIYDLVESVCSQAKVNSLSTELIDDGPRAMIAEMTEHRAEVHSPMLDPIPFQAASMLDIFYIDDELKPFDEPLVKGVPAEKQTEEAKAEESFDRLSLDWWLGLEQPEFEWLDIGSRLPSLSKEDDPKSNENERLSKEFTPADLLPLYEPDVPLEFPYPKPESSLAAHFCIDSVSGLERLHDDLVEGRAIHSHLPSSDAVPVLHDSLGECQDIPSKRTSDAVPILDDSRVECQDIPSLSKDEEDRPVSFSSSKSVPIRSRVRRLSGSSLVSEENRSQIKRPRTLRSQKFSLSHAHDLALDACECDFRRDQQAVCLFEFVKQSLDKAYSLLLLCLQLCLYLIQMLSSSLFNIPRRVVRFLFAGVAKSSITELLKRKMAIGGVVAAFLESISKDVQALRCRKNRAGN